MCIRDRGNAGDKLKQVADYITTHVDEDGVKNALAISKEATKMVRAINLPHVMLTEMCIRDSSSGNQT